MKKFGSAVILAGGKSSRMGFDKKNMIINDEFLLVSMVKKLRTIFDEIILITNTENNLDIFDNVSKDIIESQGPLSGIYTGLNIASSEFVYFIACDMPIIDKNYIEHMKSCIKNTEIDAVVTRCDNWIEPFNAFYSKSIVYTIKSFLETNQKSIFNLVKDINAIYIDECIAREYSKDFKMFCNLNTKEDIEIFLEYKSKN